MFASEGKTLLPVFGINLSERARSLFSGAVHLIYMLRTEDGGESGSPLVRCHPRWAQTYRNGFPEREDVL